MSDDGQDGRDPQQIRQVAPIRSRRRYRAQAVLFLLLVVGVAYITFKNHVAVTKEAEKENVGLRTLEDTLGAISPFAKKKVAIQPQTF
jgi:hypothetical protein